MFHCYVWQLLLFLLLVADQIDQRLLSKTKQQVKARKSWKHEQIPNISKNQLVWIVAQEKLIRKPTKISFSLCLRGKTSHWQICFPHRKQDSLQAFATMKYQQQPMMLAIATQSPWQSARSIAPQALSNIAWGRDRGEGVEWKRWKTHKITKKETQIYQIQP